MPSADIERRIVSLLFCDLVGFTSLSETLDAEDVSIVQDGYFAGVKDAIARYGGTVEKFIGDAAVGVFGVPVSRDDDAERATRAGFSIVGSVERLCARLGLEPDVLQVRVGVNTGEAIVHPDPAPGEAMVTGDTVNTAARLQAAAPVGGLLVGPTTALAVAEAIELEDAGALELKGKAEPLRAWRAVAVLPERSRERAMGVLSAPMLGRDAELAALSDGLDRASAGRSVRNVLVAPPGVGKTRLITEFASIAARRGAAIRRARLRPDVLAPYGAVVELLVSALEAAWPGSATDRATAETALRGSLATVGVPAVRADVLVTDTLNVVWPEGPTSGSGDADRREALFGSWRSALSALGDGPELWLVEDVHWAGGDLLAFLAATEEDTQRGRLIVATARPSLLEVAPDWAASAELLDLAPLDRPDAGALIEALVGDAFPDEVIARIIERSDGNPLFIEELLRTWISTGILRPEGAAWRLGTPSADVPLPPTVQAIYAAQLDDLPGTARGVARTASVAGRRFPAAALAPLGLERPEDGLEILARRALVSGPTPSSPFGDSYSYRHALLRDAGYASLARAERGRLHVRMARWLEGASGTQVSQVAEVIGRHYAAALEAATVLAADVGDGLSRTAATELAAGWFEAGAEHAMGLAAHDAAAALLRLALELTAEDDALARSRRLTGLARATAFVSDMDEGTRLAREALALLRTLLPIRREDLDVREAIAATTWLLCRILAEQLRFHEVVELCQRGLTELGEREDGVTGRLLVSRGLGRAMISDDELRTHERGSLERVLAIAEASGDRNLELDARFWLTLDDDKDEWRTIADLALELGRLDAAAQGLRVATAMALPDTPEEALRLSVDLVDFSVGHGLTEERAWAAYWTGEIQFHRGAWDEAWEALTQALEIGISHAYHRATVRSWHVATLIADARGDAASIARAARWYEERKDDLPDSPYARASGTQFGLLIARNGGGEPPPADLDHLAAAFSQELYLPSWFGAVDLIVASWLEAGEVAPARGAVEAFAAGDNEDRGRFGRGVASLLRGRVLEEPDPVRTALESFREIGTPWWVAKALRLLERIGASTDAGRTEAEAIERRLGLEGPVRPPDEYRK